jgi:hypothetical protein
VKPTKCAVFSSLPPLLHFKSKCSPQLWQISKEHWWKDDCERRNQIRWSKTCPNATLWVTDSIWTALEFNPDLRDEKPTSKRLRHGPASFLEKSVHNLFCIKFLSIKHLKHFKMNFNIGTYCTYKTFCELVNIETKSPEKEICFWIPEHFFVHNVLLRISWKAGAWGNCEGTNTFYRYN